MKSFLITIFMASIVSTNVTANSAVLGLGLDSCAKVIENVGKNDDLGKVFKAAYAWYVKGFFSGFNLVYEDDTGLNEFEELYLKVLSNCKATRDVSFVAAIINLYAEIKK